MSAGFAFLPDDVLHIIGAFAGVRDIVAMRCTSPAMRSLTDADGTFWERMCARLSPPDKQLSRPKGRTWRQHFCRELFPFRRVELSCCASIYNPSYYCVISAAVFSANTITLEFNVRGDRSLGDLQPARESVLFRRRRVPGRNRQIQVSPASPVIASELTIEGPNEAKGTLSYRLGVADLLNHAVLFQFGSRHGGYSEAVVCELVDSDFVYANSLEHLLPRQR